MSNPVAVTAPELIQLRRSPWITRPIDNTSLEAFTQCDWKFWASMVQHRQREGAPPPPLSAGSAWHKMMEAHYKTGGDRNAVLQALIMGWEPHDRPDDHRTPERLTVAYDAYIRFWGDHDTETRQNGRTVGFDRKQPNNGNPLVEAPVEISWPGALHPYVGRIDRIYELNGLFYVEDHKTTTQMGKTYFHQFDPSAQLMGYAWLATKLTGLKISGVRINATAILKTETKLARKVFSYSDERLQEWADNYNRLIERLEERYRKDPEAKMLDNQDVWPRTWRCAERWGRMCKYADVCTTSYSRRMQVLTTEFAVKPWDPMTMVGEVEIVDD